jgi:glycosyltransferase involved in cell wall biosynthesis
MAEVDMNNPLISIVVVTKNEEIHIENCLKSIRLQSYTNIEVIVVDNFSSDKTIQIAKRYADHVIQVGPERSNQRNYGFLKIATGQYGFYVDADMILAPNLLKSFVKHISNEITGYYIEEIVLGKTLFNRIRRFERFFYSSTPVDAVRIFPLENFKKVDGFSSSLFESGGGEDWDLTIKLSHMGKFILLPMEKNYFENLKYFQSNFPEIFDRVPITYWESDVVIFHNESELKFINYLKKKLYYTKGFEGYVEKWGRDNSFIEKQFGFSYRYLKVFFEKGKWKMALSRPHLVIAILIYKFLVGVVYLQSKLKKEKYE